MTSPLYHGAVLCVSHTAADYGPTNHCRIDPVDGGRARDNGANIQNLHVAIYGVLLMKKRQFSSIACLMGSSSWWQRHTSVADLGGGGGGVEGARPPLTYG